MCIRDRLQTHNSNFGELAQLGERLVCNQEVTGSSPVFSTRHLEIGGIGKAKTFPNYQITRFPDSFGSLTIEYPANGSFFRPQNTRPPDRKVTADTQCAERRIKTAG